jgi:CRP-like cAMP-binding protein
LRLFANIIAIPKHRIIKRIKFIRNVTIFSMLDESILEKIAKTLFERFFEHGSYICHEGDYGDELYIIIEGGVEIIKESDHSNKIIATKSVGDFIGEFAILCNLPRTAALKTIGKTRLYILKATYFREILSQNPEMQSKLLEILVHMLLKK